jgi:hypothetical protein
MVLSVPEFCPKVLNQSLFAWQNMTLGPGDKSTIGISWLAETLGDHEIRTFAVTNWTDPALINTAESIRITVVLPEA